MKFRLGAPPDSLDTPPSTNEWSKITTKLNHASVLTQLGYLFAMVGVLVGGHLIFGEGMYGLLDNPYALLIILFLPPVVAIIHETIHVLAQPSFGFTERTVVGFWPKILSPYVVYRGVLSRSRMLVILLAPFLFLSFIPLLVAPVFGEAMGVGVLAAIFNAASSVADLAGAFVLARKVPAGAHVASHSGVGWWRHVSTTLPS